MALADLGSARYAARGVSATKEDVHAAIQKLDPGLFPKAFCKVVADHLTGDPEHCLIMHADGARFYDTLTLSADHLSCAAQLLSVGAGTKSSLAYMYWKETGDLSEWRGIAQDAIVMNVDDLLCAGAIDNMVLSSTIGRNKNLVPGSVISGARLSRSLLCSAYIICIAQR